MSAEAWDSLGKEGRTFMGSGPSAVQISALTGLDAKQPIRVYAGRESSDSVDGVAQRVVNELERTGGFDRAVLAVVTTTGRGWVNDDVASAFEYVQGGDTAIAAMQYSFLPSPLAFIADRETPMAAGRALFNSVYAKWIDLPLDKRPKLVVFGESSDRTGDRPRSREHRTWRRGWMGRCGRGTSPLNGRRSPAVVTPAHGKPCR